MRVWADKTEIAVGRFLPWIGIGTSKFHDWKARFGKVNEHNTWVPRDHWLTDAEKEGIRGFARQHPLEGYRRLTFMMLDADVVACSPASVYRVLRAAGLLAGHTPTPTKKGTGFVQPLRPHEHWHVDVSYLNIAGTFYFLCSILDGCSRFIVHWEIREKMEEIDVETIIQRAREAYPDATAADHLRQRPAVHRQGLQGIHPHLRHDPCENLALLPPKQRQDRTLAQDSQRRLHPRAHAAVAGRRPPDRGRLRHALQHRPPAQRHRLHHAPGQARRPRS